MKSAYSLSHFLLLSYSITAQNSVPSLPVESPDTAKVGADVISVHDINFHEKEYTIRFWLLFVHDNPDLIFPGGTKRIFHLINNTLKFKLKVHYIT